MNKILVTAILSILVVGGGAYYFTQVRGSSGVSVPSSTEVDLRDSLTLKGLLGLGRNLQCSFSGNGVNQGTIYVSGNKVRGDFVMDAGASGTLSANMISDGDWIYYWSSAMPQGVKVKAEATVTNEGQNSSPTLSESFNPNVAVDYRCNTWGVDAGKFNIPSDIVFVDLSAQTEMMIQDMQDSKSAQCSSCDYLSGEAANVCKQSLGC